jgi:hypothetical protein
VSTTQGWRPRALGSPSAARSLQRLFDVSAQFLVQVLPRSPELLDQRIDGAVGQRGKDGQQIGDPGLVDLVEDDLPARVGHRGFDLADVDRRIV